DYTQSQGKSYSLCRLGKNECYSPDLVTPTLVPTQQPTPAVAETVTPTNVPESTPTPTSVPVGSDLQLIKEAIESYRSASNGLPNTLSDLVPTYLNESIALSQFSYIVDTENQQYLLCDTRDGQGFICIDSRIPESS
ncbi:hypothetical protein KC571_01415, partial [candidate division WWE3 bacterium]|nr:hypothetical protein [candidate division WWE3 bacterium]